MKNTRCLKSRHVKNYLGYSEVGHLGKQWQGCSEMLQYVAVKVENLTEYLGTLLNCKVEKTNQKTIKNKLEI